MEWKGTTYGGNRLHRWLIRLLRITGVRAVHVFAALCVVPVCMAVSRGSRTAYAYFRGRQGMGRLRSVIMTYRNLCLFAQVVIDRFAMYAGYRYTIEMEGWEHFSRLAALPGGFVQLSAHIGNYELAGYTLRADRKRFNALVFSGEKESVMRNRARMFQDKNIRMIGVSDDMSHLFLMNDALAAGEILSMPADRLIGSPKHIALPFLGREAHFPLGPFSMATLRGVPVIAVNVMKTAPMAYRIYITPLQYDTAAPRATQQRQLAGAYVRELERMMRLYPEQWYNYYDFWK